VDEDVRFFEERVEALVLGLAPPIVLLVREPPPDLLGDVDADAEDAVDRAVRIAERHVADREVRTLVNVPGEVSLELVGRLGVAGGVNALHRPEDRGVRGHDLAQGLAERKQVAEALADQPVDQGDPVLRTFEHRQVGGSFFEDRLEGFVQGHGVSLFRRTEQPRTLAADRTAPCRHLPMEDSMSSRPKTPAFSRADGSRSAGAKEAADRPA
jgi:hypothetical protein